MEIRLYGARILTMAEDEPIFEGEVWTRDDRIDFVGTAAQAEAEQTRRKRSGRPVNFTEEIDADGDLLMPGFKDAHTHSAMCLMRSAADDLPLQDWLTGQIFPIEAKLTPEDIYTLTRLSILEYLTSGITAIFEMYLTPESIADACLDSGMRCVQVGAMNDFSQSPELVAEMYERLNGRDDLNSYMLGFHAEYTTSEERLVEIARLAENYKAPVYTHISETRAEHEGCIERRGMTPVAYLASLGLFEYGGGGYHLVYATDDDIRIMRDKGMYAVTNPASNTKLASGIAPIRSFIEAGIPVAIGTDGPASNNCLDMFREMFLTTGLAKLRDMDASSVDAGMVLRMATVNGAHAMGLTDCDILAAGKKADLIMLDMSRPSMQPVHNIVKNLVYSGGKDIVRLTMINGVIRYRDGSFSIGEEPRRLYREAEAIKRRVYG